MDNDISKEMPGFYPIYPILIHMIDTGEEFIAKRMEDIPASRIFLLLKTKVKLDE